MKIAFITPEFPHPKIGVSGGIGTSILNLSKGLVQLGHEVLILIYGQSHDEVFHENGITFHRIKNVQLKSLTRYLTQKKVEKYINSLIKEAKIDVVEASEWTGFTYCMQIKCPVVIKLHGSDTYFCHLDNRPVKWFNKLQEKIALNKATALLSVSGYTAQVTKKIFSLHREFTIIPNCIDIEKFETTDNSEKSQNNTILYFGTLIRKKGLLELPLIFNEVYKENKKAKLLLIGRDAADIISGNPSTWEMMKGLFTTESFKNVSYLGSVHYDEIKSHINEATVCVFPTFAEALPVSWLEAMAMKKAIIASNIGWAKEVIDHNVNGFLEHPTDHKKYAKSIIALLENEALRNKFGTEARKKVEEKFSIEVVAKQSAAFYKKII